MIRVTVSYPQRAGSRFDHAYYQAEHRALLNDRLGPHGLMRLEMDQALADGTGGPPPVVAAAHMLFASLDAFKVGMAACGAELMADVARYTDIAPTIVISETR